MRALPEMSVVAPGDPEEAAAATEAVAAHDGPCYLRLGRAGEQKVYTRQINFRLGKAIQLREGSDLTLISTGGMLQTAVETSEALSHKKLQARVLSMHTLKPLDIDAILAAARETGAIFTLEEHSIIGGLGSAVAETLAEFAEREVAFKRFALPSAFACKSGTQEYLRARFGLGVESLTNAIHAASREPRLLAAGASF
jgi:transketolase